MKDYDLEEAARQYRDEFLDKNDNDISKYDIEDIFIAGAEWQKQQFVLKLESLCKEWHLHTSAEAKYRIEAYQELLEMLKEEKK